MQDTKDAALVRHNGGAVSATRPSFVSLAADQWRMAENLAKADIIPKDFRGKPANVFVALEMAHRLNISPMEAMQNIYVVHGTPSMSAKFLIGLANSSGRFRGGLRFREEGRGPELAVTCYAKERETGDEMAVTVTMAQAKTAGWSKNQKYVEMPAQMLSYRAATFFVRRYCPEVAMGMVTVEEAEEMPREPREVSHDPLDDTLTPIEAPKPAPKEEPKYLPDERVQKMIRAFTDMGVDYSEVLDRMGDPEKVTVERYREMEGWYKELRAARDSHQGPDEEEYLRPEPSNLYGAPEDAPEYD